MECLAAIRSAWAAASEKVALQPEPFLAARDKEMKVKEAFSNELRDALPEAHVQLSRSGSQIKFGPKKKEIDLTVAHRGTSVAIEAKVKVQSFRAITHNRSAAFDDLEKLRQYTQCGDYAHGVFIWLTDCPEYYQNDVSAKSDCSTHHGRVYVAGTPLKTAQTRDRKPREWKFPWTFTFAWQRCTSNAAWRWLLIQIPPLVKTNEGHDVVG